MPIRTRLISLRPEEPTRMCPLLTWRIGTDQLRKQIIAGVSEADIRKSWEPGLQNFKAIRMKYLLYP